MSCSEHFYSGFKLYDHSALELKEKEHYLKLPLIIVKNQKMVLKVPKSP